MKTLADYILDAQAREARFLKSTTNHTQAQWRAYENSKAQVLAMTGEAKVESVLQPNFVTSDGIPCHNSATRKYYESKK